MTEIAQWLKHHTSCNLLLSILDYGFGTTKTSGNNHYSFFVNQNIQTGDI